MPDERRPPLPPIAFLDRDGTIIEDRHYPSDPDQVFLLPGAAEAIRLLNEADVKVVVVTNQSGIARGMYGVEDYERVAARLDALLAREGARADSTQFCPHHPDVSGPCDCRKPAPGMFIEGAGAVGRPTTGALFAGDRLRDVLPSVPLGGRGVLVPSVASPAEDLARAEREFEVAPSLLALVTSVLEGRRIRA